MAKTYDSELILIHVVDKTRKSDILAGAEYTEILRKYAKEVMETAQKIANHEGVKAKTVTKEGNVANEIVQYSKESKSDLIVWEAKALAQW